MNLRRFVSITGVAFVAFTLFPSHSFTGQTEDATETARLLAILLDAGRVTIAKNQELINDSARGDKGFTPEVFEKQLDEEFRHRTGFTLAQLEKENLPEMAKPLLLQLLEESKKTIASYQPVINIMGVRYKGLIPATFGTETATRFNNRSGVYLKQTAPQTFIRNPKNAPDAYEAEAFTRLATKSSESNSNHVESELVDQGRSIRVMLPLFYGKACLTCHGEPKGQRDISGYPREGGKEGDLGGAISVKISLK
jgi:general secretion pathway protein A